MKDISLTVNGRTVNVPEDFTVLKAIEKAGHYVPTLCHDATLKPFGACRLCIVKIEGLRGLPTSCTTPAQEGMVVQTETEEIQKVRRIIVELMIANHPLSCLECNSSQICELLKVAQVVGVQERSVKRLRRGKLNKPQDTSNPAYNFDPNKCILCGRCVRTCDEIVGIGAIDFAYRGQDTMISPFGAKPLALSECQTCGECVEHCPTGALRPKQDQFTEKEVKTICPYCGVGCAIYLGLRGQTVVQVRGDVQSPVNRGELCVKGRYGIDFIHHPERLTRPLMRLGNGSKTVFSSEMSEPFKEADWDQALGRIVQEFKRIREHHGPDSIGVLSSAKCTNEDNYILQKFARAGLGTNNVDHCARLCHASTVAAAMAAFGDGAMSNSLSDVDLAEVFFVIGSNTTDCHPIIGRKIRRAIRNKEARLIVADPRAIELSESAEVYLGQFPGTDVALLNGMMRQIVDEGLYNKTFITQRCEEFEPFLESLAPYDLKTVEDITGVAGETIRRAALLFGQAKRAMVLYGMGITQHITGTENVKTIANLLMLTGNLGRPGTGFAPLRGQNNVQGACDMGALPVVFPGYQRVDNPSLRKKFEKAWGKRLSEKPGLTVTEMFQAAEDGELKALYVMGENPMLSEPDLNHAKRAVAKLEMLVVQDIFLTETALLADVVLPATSFAEKNGTFTNTERRIQLVRQALAPPGEAREDWKIICDLSTRSGFPMNYESSAKIMDEISQLTPIYGGITHDRLSREGLQWPCWDAEHPGTPMLHKGEFTRGRGLFHVVHDRPPAELPTKSYPIILTTGRILEHWHTGSMSHRSHVLESLAPESRVEINPLDALQLGLEEGDVISLSSRRGAIQTKVKKTQRVRPGQAFLAFHWKDAPANRLTNPVFDPQAKIPEFKVSSVKAILTVLEKAAADNKFLAALVENPAGVLSSFDLSPEHRKAIVSGEIAAIEQWVGPLEKRLQVWLKARLRQENLT